MNARTTIIALVITCALAAVAFLVFQGGSLKRVGAGVIAGSRGGSVPLALPQWYQQLSVTQADQLQVKHIDGSSTLIARDPHLRSLMIEKWPIQESTADAALRLISQAVPTTRKAPSKGSLAHVEVTLNGQHVLRLHPQSLGGGVVVSLDELDMALDCDPRLISLFEPQAMLAWRSPAALPFLSQGNSGVPSLEQVKVLSLDAPGKVVQLERRGRSWRVGKLGYGQTESCESLLQMLGTIKVIRFIGPPDSIALNWIEIPKATITVDSDLRQLVAPALRDAGSTQLRVRTLRQELRLGGSADGTGKHILAHSVGYWIDDTNVLTPAYGPMVVVIESQSVGALNLDRLGYVSQSPLPPAILPVADITSLYLGDELTQEQLENSAAPMLASAESLKQPGSALNRIVLRRTLDGWKTFESPASASQPAADESAGKPMNKAAIKSLLDVLTSERASERASEKANEKSTTQISDVAPPGIKPVGTLVVATARGPQEILYIASRDERNGARQLCIRVAGLYYLFSEKVSEPVLSFMREIMPTQG